MVVFSIAPGVANVNARNKFLPLKQQQKNYHNLKFKATAEAHGLHIEKHDKYGWTVTTLAPEAWIWETLCKDKINASRLPVEGTTKGGSKKTKNRSIKYVCPFINSGFPPRPE